MIISPETETELILKRLEYLLIKYEWHFFIFLKSNDVFGDHFEFYAWLIVRRKPLDYPISNEDDRMVKDLFSNCEDGSRCLYYQF